MSKHVGFPLPSEMFHTQEEKDFEYEEKIAELLEIPLKCPYCSKVLKRYNNDKKNLHSMETRSRFI